MNPVTQLAVAIHATQTAPGPSQAFQIRDRNPWMNDALCTEIGPDLFFAEIQGDKASTVAKKVCDLCPVKAMCLDYALTFSAKRLFGVWGETTHDERALLARGRRAGIVIDLENPHDTLAYIREHLHELQPMDEQVRDESDDLDDWVLSQRVS